MTAGTPVPPKGHIARLDVLRAVAFLAVYLFHFTGNFNRAHVPWNGLWRDYSAWPRELLVVLPIVNGSLGVTLFFVLSGFCIHYATLRREETFSPRDFFWRRFLRLYPAYLVAVLVIACFSPWLPTKYFNFWQIPAHLLLVHNLVNETFFGINGSFWSLAVEAQFYLLYPLLLFLAARWGLARSFALALGLNLLCYVHFGHHSKSSNPVHSTWSFPLVTWCDWILGALLAEAHLKRRPLFFHPKSWLVTTGALLVLVVNFKPLNVQAYLFAAVFFAVLMQLYLAWKSPLTAPERALIPVGIISYSLYLWHEPVIELVDRVGAAWGLTRTPLAHGVWDLGVATVLSAIIATASYHFLEVGGPRAIRAFMQRRHLRVPPLPGPAVEEQLLARPPAPRD